MAPTESSANRIPQSATFAVNVPNLCARCHREGQKAAVRYTGTQHEIITNYTESIHGTLLKNGLTVTATCTSCHTAHHILPRTDPASSVNANNVPTTCGQCHHGIEEQFENSIHSKRVSGYSKPLPVCNDCHTAHSIHRTDENSFRLNVMGTCGRCHEEIAKTYFDTYHGKVSKLGYTKAAKCYDCHGAHDVLKVTDPRSHLSRANVAATCAKCHAGATRRFAGYLTHATHHDPKKYPFVFYTFWGMTGLLVGTFVVGGIHTLLWLPRAFQMRRELRDAEEKAAAELGKPGSQGGHRCLREGKPVAHPMPEDEVAERQFVRFTRLQRILHVCMIVSFITLATTGLTLKFSYTRWAAIVSHLLGGFESAGYIHRSAAVVMFGVFITHLVDLYR
jgi:hypothetical protein